MKTGLPKSESLRASPLTMNSWPLHSGVSPWTSAMQCINGASLSMWHCSEAPVGVMITEWVGSEQRGEKEAKPLARLKPSPPCEPRLNVFFLAYRSRGEKWQCYLYFLLRQTSLISAGFISCLINLYTWSNTFWKVLEGKTFLHAKLSRWNLVRAGLTKVTVERFFGCLSKVNFFLPWIIFLWVGNEMSDTSNRRSVNSSKWNILYTWLCLEQRATWIHDLSVSWQGPFQAEINNNGNLLSPASFYLAMPWISHRTLLLLILNHWS